jgi:hypothetical protein
MQPAFEAAMAEAQKALDPRECATAQAEGTALTLEQVVAAVLPPAVSPSIDESTDSLEDQHAERALHFDI